MTHDHLATTASLLESVQVGQGPDVILIHGAMTCLDDMAIALFPALQSEFRVTAFDRPGHGRNAPVSITGTPWRQARAVHQSAKALGLVRPVVVGHSFGGAIALAYALQYPDDTAGIVALSPIAFPEVRLEHLVFAPRAGPGPIGSWIELLAGAIDPVLLPILWRAMFFPQEMPSRFAQAFPFAMAGRNAQTVAEGQDAALMVAGVALSAANYGRCRVPVHVMAGDRDLVVNAALHAAGLARCLPNARFSKLSGLGHMVQHFAQPAIAEAIRDMHAIG